MVLMRTIASGDRRVALSLLVTTPALAVAKLNHGAQRTANKDFFFADW